MVTDKSAGRFRSCGDGGWRYGSWRWYAVSGGEGRDGNWRYGNMVIDGWLARIAEDGRFWDHNLMVYAISFE
ncbi:hypothetical protein L6452_08288 [Arctium lappa]|uniref:Uncharacterized protein n=1 Tax=Arctium lappa TaxID=4217 RepID=A0ACB9DH57_ARCLA|nr:hypothetical protein L6452_08288 [Arctium lappa]